MEKCCCKTVNIIDHLDSKGPSAYGKDELINAIKEQGGSIRNINYWTQLEEGICIIMGKTTDRLIEKLLAENEIDICNKPESIVYQWCSTGHGEVLVIGGSDEKGVMYALLEVSDRIRIYGLKVLWDMENAIETPDNMIRSVSRFVLSRRDDEWFYSEEFWNYYFKRLAKYRYNRFVLILGFDTSYFSPPYPFFVKVPGYEGVKAIGLSDDDMANNLLHLRRIGQLCRKYGLEFNLATWQQTPWTANQSFEVQGLAKDEDQLGDYCALGLKELLRQCEEIEVIQLRVNFEAGVGTQTTNGIFWKKLINAVSECGRKVKLALRAKGLTDDLINFALEKGLELEVPTKHWCEHIALPYHLSQMREEELARLDNLNHSRRYSYGNMLKKPHWYDIIYRLWNYGSNTLFLFGDPDYVRRFSYSLEYGDSIGFEITAPLSLKGGQASIKGEPWPIFRDESLRYYRWEDERYWAWYLFFGRIGYSRNEDADVWKREFREHFKEGASYIEDAYRSGSKILPLITSAHMPVHPSLQYWTELCTGAALFEENNYNTAYKGITYGNTEPSDPGLFYKICDYVEDVLSSNLQGKYTPLQVRDWLKIFSKDVRDAIEKADKVQSLTDSREYRGTKVDLLMLADLADYHANKIMAAVKLCFFDNTKEYKYIASCYKYMCLARDYWKSLCDRGSVYHYNLEFSAGAGDGIGKRGHWKDRLPEIEKDVAKVKSLMEAAPWKEFSEDDECIYNAVSGISSNVPEFWYAGDDLEITVDVSELVKLKSGLNMHYRHMDQTEGKFKMAPMEKTDTGYRAVIPREYITPEWDIMVYFSGVDLYGNTVIYPGIYHPEYLAPYHIIKIMKGI